MSHTDLIIIISIIGLSSTVGVWVLVRKISQYTPTPHNVLMRSGGDIELTDYIEPAQPLPIYYPSGWLQEPINWIESNRVDSINVPTVIEGLNSDHISSIVSPLNSISEVESLDYDSLNLEPFDYNIDDLFIHSILENEYNLYYLFYIIIILVIIISIFIMLKNKTTKF